MLNKILELLEEFQLQDILSLDVKAQTTITDTMVIATGRSSRHVTSSAQNLIEAMKKEGHIPIGSSGFENGEWVLVDFGDVIVNIMQASTRVFYNLEGLWQTSDDSSLTRNEN